MGGLGEALLALIAEFGLPAVLGFLVDEGILPPWVLGETSGQAVETEPYAIERIATTAANEAINPFHGFSALLTRMNRLSTQIETDANALAEAIGNINFDTQPGWYVPPTTPPDETTVATAVWDYQPNEEPPRSAWTYQREAGLLSESIVSRVALPLVSYPGYQLSGPWGGGVSFGITHWPTALWADVRDDDTRLSWLQRTDPDAGWTANSLWNPTYEAYRDEADNVWTVELSMTEQEFALLRPQVAGNSAPHAPVWPGYGNVDYGTPVALAPGLTIDVACHGVIVAVTAVASKVMHYTYDDVLAYRHIGALAFKSEDGDLEPYQMLSFANAIYTCKSLDVAAGIKLMCPSGTEGTVTPWLRKDTVIPF
jgi:hypothetical protein